MDPVEKQLARLKHNPENWSARTELAHLWREQGISFEDHELLAGATGAPRNRAELQRLLDALAGPPRTTCWIKVLEEYLWWGARCPLGLVSLAHVKEASGDSTEALALYEKAIEIDPSVSEPPLACMRKEEAPKKHQELTLGRILEDSRYVSLIVAIIAHLFLIILLSFWAISSSPPMPPQIVATPPPEDISDSSQAAPEKISISPITATTSLQIVSASDASEMSVTPMSLSVPNSSFTLGETSFSPSMSFGQDSGGSVSFFGSQGKTKNLIYVVDVSGSMQQQGKEGKSRVELMKEELTRSISVLPLSVKYQIIFFSHTAWFAGQEPDINESLKTDNPEALPSRLLLRATQSQIRKTLEQIDQVRIGGGTNWRLPLKMAIKLEPDLIYFMTDGEVTSDNGETPVIEDVVNYNRSKSNARINTICLMEPKAFDKLKELANRTRGSVFLVKENGEVLRGLQIDQLK